ncbi:MAG: ABC transporter substrate-binding protein [Actinomycetaceae bacterium]|nr:ABC transporter substrate-binding protein [Actinomycetaceae bacterium]MDY6082943.1 ABC transporter substrate-binding protein [Actinomycetaceae bacterium]
MLSWIPDTNHIGIYVARNKGYYAAAGLNVTVTAVAQAGAEQAVNSSLADFALSTLTNVGIDDAKGARIAMVMQVQQKPSAIWCALASETAITSPKDFDSKTFATFGTSESDAVVKRMIQFDGGRGIFDKVTVGTSTFQTLQSGKADFGGFYDTWEGVQSRLNGPALRCFKEADYGVPGNADSIGIITHRDLMSRDPDLVRSFVQATQQGYAYAYAHPDEAAHILVQEAKSANVPLDLAAASMTKIRQEQYWGDAAAVASGHWALGTIDKKGVQQYLDFLSASGALVDANGFTLSAAPKVDSLATNDFLDPAVQREGHEAKDSHASQG